VACGKLGEMNGGEGLTYVAAMYDIWCALGRTCWCNVSCCFLRGWLDDAWGVWHGRHAVSIPHIELTTIISCMINLINNNNYCYCWFFLLPFQRIKVSKLPTHVHMGV